MKQSSFQKKYICYVLMFCATILLILGIVYECYKKEIKDNKVYVVNQHKKQRDITEIDGQIDTKGINKFYSVKFKETNNKIPLTQSPDKKYIFYLSPNMEYNENDNKQMIIGVEQQRFSLNKYEVKTGDNIIIKEKIPPITEVKWNKNGNIVAFCGGNKLTIYNIEDSKFMFENEVKNDFVTYFGWSPDGKRLYTEHPNLVNNSIYYIDSNEKVEAYNAKEHRYYKGKIDNEYYYATVNEIDKPASEQVYTLILDKNGKQITKFHKGKYRDSYIKSTTLSGQNGFGLYYIEDINNPEKSILIDRKYIYNAKFIYDGKIVYTIQNTDVSKNNFLMNVVNSNGKRIKQVEVSGGEFVLLPDGKKARVFGKDNELIDFENNIVSKKEKNNKKVDLDETKIFETIREAVNIIPKYISSQDLNVEMVKPYFIDSNDPVQSALFDIKKMYKEKSTKNFIGLSQEFYVTLWAANYKKYNKNGIKKAVLNLRGDIKNGNSTSIKIDVEVELINSQKDNKWYITGVSTFTESEEYVKVKKLCNKYIQQLQKGLLFKGSLKGKKIILGQIQFWNMRENCLASKAEYATHCKVYLKIKENNEEKIYEMILHKGNEEDWKPIELNALLI
ncbi:hypothetical protein ACFIJ5_16145 [Haloimpatiens sp. FM7330]|uniref:hypothetical protein n=1 Tax=Haloimpatiens sp. FM7330 TaxID=3298610 RepID=UPI0036402143